MTTIRRMSPADWPETWLFVQAMFRAGTTFPQPPDIDEASARRFWLEQPTATCVAADATDRPVGSYYLKPNQPGQGAHVANAGYVVAAAYRGRGIGTALCRHSLSLAQDLGFRALQFNLVVVTNHSAIRCYQRLGFDRIGVLPRAFAHPTAGDVDALVFFKNLAS